MGFNIKEQSNTRLYYFNRFNIKNIELTQEFDDSGKPVIFSGDIKLIEQNPPDYKLYEITIPEKEN